MAVGREQKLKLLDQMELFANHFGFVPRIPLLESHMQKCLQGAEPLSAAAFIFSLIKAGRKQKTKTS